MDNVPESQIINVLSKVESIFRSVLVNAPRIVLLFNEARTVTESGVTSVLLRLDHGSPSKLFADFHYLRVLYT